MGKDEDNSTFSETILTRDNGPACEFVHGKTCMGERKRGVQNNQKTKKKPVFRTDRSLQASTSDPRGTFPITRTYRDVVQRGDGLLYDHGVGIDRSGRTQEYSTTSYRLYSSASCLKIIVGVSLSPLRAAKADS